MKSKFSVYGAPLGEETSLEVSVEGNVVDIAILLVAAAKESSTVAGLLHLALHSYKTQTGKTDNEIGNDFFKENGFVGLMDDLLSRIEEMLQKKAGGKNE